MRSFCATVYMYIVIVPAGTNSIVKCLLWEKALY